VTTKEKKMEKFLFLIKANDSEVFLYDCYAGAVVCASSAEEARTIHPNGRGDKLSVDNYTWVRDPEQVIVTLIGVADQSVKKGVVLASFNAG